MKITRRTALKAGAAGMAGAVLPRPGTASAGTAGDTAVQNAAAGDLEQRALAMTPPVFLLETAVPPQITAGPGSVLSITDRAAICGSHSLRWEHGSRSTITVSAPLGFSPDPYRPLDDQAWQGTVDTFSVWIFNEVPVDDVVRFEFGRGDRTDAWFEFRLGFTGWRTAWVRYDYDMHGRPHPGMDTLRIVAPRRAGTLHLDQLMLNAALRPDAPCRDAQVPDIAKEGDDYDAQQWQALYLFDRLLAKARFDTGAPSAEETASLRALVTRYRDEYLVSPVKVDDASVAALTAQVAALGVPEASSTGLGRPVFSYQSQIYPSEIAAELTTFVNAVTLSASTDLMKALALAHTAAGAAHRPALAALYIRMIAHLRDQGWTRGSCQGTIHHLGYNVRGYYDSVYLMKDVLREADLFEQVRADLGWLTGFGRIFRDRGHRQAHCSVMDIFNTTLRGMLAVALLRDTEAEQVAYLRALLDWLNWAMLPTDGIQDGLKVDGSVFHHVGFFPDYVRDGFTGLAPMVYVLSGGVFRLGSQAHTWLKRALLTMRVYANKNHWPISISGRNPSGLTALSPVPYQWLAISGTPDGSSDVDPEIAAAFLRLLPAAPTAQQRQVAERLTARGITAEPAPTGNWTVNYAALAVHRRQDWQVTVRGHNRYLWSTEIYEGANWYGRYNTYGQIQVLHRGNPIGNADSGYAQAGWDWNRRPGTTTVHRPLDELRGDLTGAIEEMLLTDSRFGGAHTIDGRNGMFAMELREHPKYEGSHRALKSVFLFDDRIVAVGTGIENDSPHPTETTLFQTRLSSRSAPTYVDGTEPVTAFPYDAPDLAPRWLLDDKGIGYHLAAGQRAGLTRTTQASRDNATEAPTSGDFATAWIRHGASPRGGSYQYAMVVGTTPERMAAFAAAMADPASAPYTVLRADTSAHVVSDRATGITGYAVFKPLKSAEGPVREVDTPSMVLLRGDGDDGLVLAVCDPDLRLYSGIDPDQYERGRYVGHYSPWSRPWLTSPSHPHLMRVTLQGRWRADGDQPCKARVRGETTVVEFETVDGRPVQVRLLRG
ncbi:chondroitinase family polysaccharide lyase [Streptosporangium sp. NBC_01756]|uniref:chondroitinase family polysaccharide lyase n=1 Tax=Streptosporangium sp. NBC_01756 TaxID=2975950 RepID=UPI002DD891BE|nr:chondroitinase family polysaccharide lyase [Streptosporangium sp. NBC_01756]WSC87430.1 chondroitinase family polysaccharide lyase [Streptosporangium sp. NBC_01756]